MLVRGIIIGVVLGSACCCALFQMIVYRRKESSRTVVTNNFKVTSPTKTLVGQMSSSSGTAGAVVKL